ncbi:AraC family transcriptional regulator [Spongiibacter sp. KMU-158]|uniref:AraC family transcriptional regulator n=1 Tax=Spongiibacter pelagi TaxID=2760804 RepID=A0A927C1L3_9GAMM|nr:AraC family transcriptional regulator [Spongiibacter pelagi]MBD2859604.1 AraC family transcriptional regulator [Spongiibacter pelagi]
MNKSSPNYFALAALKHLPPRLKEAVLMQNGLSEQGLQDDAKALDGRLHANLVRDIMLACDDEQIGYGQEPQPLGSWATMTQLCLSAENLGEALRRLARFYRLVPWGIETRLETGERETRFIMRPVKNTAFEPYLYESFLFYVYRFSNWLINRQIPLSKVEFNFPVPPQRNQYRYLFHISRFEFDQPQSQFSFPNSYFKEPIRQDAQSLKRFLMHTNLHMIVQDFSHNSWQYRVQQSLSKNLADNPGIEQIAASLGVHPHTLRQRLQSESSQFHEIKQNLRSELACDLLRNSKQTIEAIACQLGFSETSAFSRAFKSWTGSSPLRYRQANSI